MLEIEMKFSKSLYKRMQLYLLSLMFVLSGFLMSAFNPFYACPALIGLVCWILAITYGRLWMFKPYN